MRIIRLVPAALAVALCGFPVMAGTSAAAQDAAPRHRVTTSLDVATPGGTLQHGDVLDLSATLSLSEPGTTVPGDVVLHRMEAGSQTWTAIASTPASGPLRFRGVRAEVSASYSLSYPGGVDEEGVAYAASRSEATVVHVAPRVEVVPAAASFALNGTIHPAQASTRVLLERRVGGKWRPAGSVRTRNGKFTVALRKPARRGTDEWFRVSVPASKRFAAIAEVWQTH